MKIPVLAKMTPNITDMTEPALFAKKGGADGISAVNTFRAISEIGLDDWVAKPNVFGVGAMSGYSGAAIKPIALHFIAEMGQCAELDLPLSGMGGVETWVDALEYLLVGATTVQVTTGIIKYGYEIVADIIEGLSDYMAARGIGSVSQLIGKAFPSSRLPTTSILRVKALRPTIWTVCGVRRSVSRCAVMPVARPWNGTRRIADPGSSKTNASAA